MIDPIDGTVNFIKTKRGYGILLAYFENQTPLFSYVYHIAEDQLFFAKRDEGVYINGRCLKKPENISLADALIAIEVRELQGTPVFEQVVDQAFDIRYGGSSTVDASRVMTGEVGAFINDNAGPWDYAPFILMAEELGLHISKLNGEPVTLTEMSDHIISTPQVYEELKESLNATSQAILVNQ